jgi:signal transduction histidine kinase
VALLCVDNGRVFPANKLGQIFDPFFTTRPEGTGLGLAVVAAIVRAHKGEIMVDSTPDKGTAFILRFPTVSAGQIGIDNEVGKINQARVGRA